MQRDRISLVFFFALFLFFLFQAGRLLYPFFTPLLCALAVAIVCYPMHRAVARRLKGWSPSFRAFISDIAVLIFMVVPIAVLLTSLVTQIQSILPATRQCGDRWVHWFQTGGLRHVQDWLARLSPALAQRLNFSSVDFHDRLQAYIDGVGRGIAASAAGVARHVFSFLFDLGIFQFALFFLFRDGGELYQQWNDLLPMPAPLKTRLHQRIQGTVEGVVRGAIIVGLAQGLVSMVGYFAAGVDAAVLFGCLTVVASIVPGIGTALVWIPVSLYFLFNHLIGHAIIVIVFGLIVAAIEHVLRPIVIGNRTNISFLWLTLSVLGGLHWFGIKGLLLGPLIFGLLPILFEIYRSYIIEIRP